MPSRKQRRNKRDKAPASGQLPSQFYSSRISDRKPYEDRAELIAEVTLPYVIRGESDSGSTAMTDSNAQSYGGRLVNTLKAKMGMALLPPSTSSFRYVAKPEEIAALTQGNKDNVAKVHMLMSSNVNKVNAEIEVQQVRPSLFDVLLQLLVVGSVIVEKVKGDGIMLHRLQSFVVKLDNQGRPLQWAFVEEVDILPEGVTVKQVKDKYELYTMGTIDPSGTGSWTVVQEIEGTLVGTEQTYKNYEDLPYHYLGWTWMTGDSYHRPYAEDYYKDLEQLDKLAKLLTDGAAIAAKSLILVNERGGRTRKDNIAEAGNGDVIDGDAADITSFTLDKNFDFQVPMEREANLKKELAAAFLMNESVTREAERVTAQEIRFMAQQLETSSVAGIYSKLSITWSKWIVHQVMLELDIKFEAIEVEILTGLDALGRSQEAQKLDAVLQRAEALGLRHWFHDDEILARYTAFENVNTVGLLKTPKEVDAEMKQRQQQMAEQQAAEAAAQSGGAAAGTAAVESQAPQPPQ